MSGLFCVTLAFGKACKIAGLEGLRMHDLRHEATTLLFEKKELTLMEVASITGHKDLRMLKRYTHLNPTTLARKLK
jgi:integrase